MENFPIFEKINLWREEIERARKQGIQKVEEASNGTKQQLEEVQKNLKDSINDICDRALGNLNEFENEIVKELEKLYHLK